MGFKLVQGVEVENLEGIVSAYSRKDGLVQAVISAEKIENILRESVRLLEGSLFFFLELPCTEQEEKKLDEDVTHYNVYYLDNITEPVAQAIIDRYGELLINDGLCCYGFGSLKNNEEIYAMNYQQINFYGSNDKFCEVLKNNDVSEADELKTMWDNFTSDTPGMCISVDVNGETAYDILENLKSEGMYYAQTR